MSDMRDLQNKAKNYDTWMVKAVISKTATFIVLISIILFLGWIWRFELPKILEEHSLKTESDGVVTKMVEYVDTGKTAELRSDNGESDILEVYYDKASKHVWLYRPDEDVYVPFMKTKLTQYIWNADTKKWE